MIHCWLNGQPTNSIPVDDRGLAYGDGLFETIRLSQGQPCLLGRHLQRLQEGCRRLQIAIDAAQVRNEIQAFAAVWQEGVCKLILTRGRGQRGYATDVAMQANRLLLWAATPMYPAERQRGIRLFPCTTRLAEQPLLAGLKHLNRLEQVLARAEWQDSEYAEGLLCDYAGRVIEGVFSNIFWVKQGQLLTPDLSRCGVAGVMRAEILAQATHAAIPVAIAELALAQLYQADEVFMCNSQYGIWPVTALSDSRWPHGPLTQRLQKLLADGITR